jgi:hypothetical protein
MLMPLKSQILITISSNQELLSERSSVSELREEKTRLTISLLFLKRSTLGMRRSMRRGSTLKIKVLEI